MKNRTWQKAMRMTLAAAAIMTLAGCASKTASSKGNDAGSKIKIGVNMELSGSAAAYGLAQKQGIQLAAAQINKDGGIKVNGKQKKVQLIIKDNKTTTSASSSVASQLVNNDKVQAIVGPATTNAGTAAIPNVTKAAVPMVSPSATDPNFTLQSNKKVQPYVFRSCFDNNFQGETAAKFTENTLNAKNVIVLADNSSDYGTGLAKAFKNAFTGKIVKTQYFQAGDKDFNAVLTAIKNKNFDAIFIPGYYSEAGLIIKQARQIGIKQPIIGTDGMADPKLAQIAEAKNATDVYYTTPFSTKAAETDPTAKAFLTAYKQKYHAAAPTFSALSYDSVYMIKAAIEKENSANSAKIATGLSKLKNVKGVTGAITVDKNHNPKKPISVERLTNGKVSQTYQVK